MAGWRIWDYVTDENHNLIQEWYAAQAVEVQAQFDHVVLLALAEDDWVEPEKWWFKQLDRAHLGLSEFRFSVRGKLFIRRFRPAGCYRPDVREFVFLVGCEKKLGGLKYVPDKAFDAALKHKADLELGKGRLDEHV
jgi:hypothetical protein